MSKFKTGDTAFIYDSSRGWQKVKIIRVSGNYYHIVYLTKCIAFGASEHRLLTEDEYLSLNQEQGQHTYYSPPELH